MDRLIWFCQLFCLHLLLMNNPISAKLCSRGESLILLQFKQLFSFENHHPHRCDEMQQSYSHPKMLSWKENEDCCSWNGVTCDKATGHIIGLDLSCSWLYGNIPLNTTLFFRAHLQKLNLAYNDFNHSRISSDFGSFPVLTHLNLSSSNFEGQIPFEIARMFTLVSLDLSTNSLLGLNSSVLKALVRNLSGLKELILDSVDMSSIELDSLTNLSSSLTILSLDACALQGNMPENIFSLPSVQVFSSKYNKRLIGVLPKFNWSSPLRYLDLYGCNLIGSIPASLGNLSLLTYLDLSDNKFSGQIPTSFSNLKQLRRLDLSDNNFSGTIPHIFANLTQLFYLDFSNNQLTGPIPSCVCKLQSLTTVYLFNNSLNGTIPSRLFSLPSLEDINLNNNQLTGSIPSSISELVNLTALLLSSNNLSGHIELHIFSKLKNLKGLDLSHNSLSLSSIFLVNSSFPNLSMLGLSACNISEFPDFLRTQHALQWLDLSENQIHGKMPNWVWNIGSNALNHLNLSHNFLTGIESLPWKNLRYLDLRSNLLQGSLVILPPSINFFSIKNNKLTGEIPSSFCNMKSMFYLDLSNNNLNGTIPQCLANTSLFVLDLRMNNFHGSIPQTFAKGNRLSTLNLNDNHLEGPLPPSLINCRFLEVLDVGNNKINDTFPEWLGGLPELQVLILRSNKFHGPISISNVRFPFPKLRVLDLSRNEFTGVMPTRYFQNFGAMVRGENNNAEDRNLNYGGEYYSAILTVKGMDREMVRILNIFTVIDLSSNRFQGQIPNVVGKLNSLKALNFSYNNLSNSIPSSLGNLTQLESLDLSSNKLVGKIPWELTNLNFLQVLNLSTNQLVGLVPQGKQFNTFSSDSYRGNLGLCGFPVSENCNNDEEPDTVDEEDDTWGWFDWKIAMMGYGSGLVIGLMMGYFMFATGKPQWFVMMIERQQPEKVIRRLIPDSLLIKKKGIIRGRRKG